jgi:hypothetical protein
MDYQWAKTLGATYFFTLVTHQQQSIFIVLDKFVATMTNELAESPLFPQITTRL